MIMSTCSKFMHLVNSWCSCSSSNGKGLYDRVAGPAAIDEVFSEAIKPVLNNGPSDGLKKSGVVVSVVAARKKIQSNTQVASLLDERDLKRTFKEISLEIRRCGFQKETTSYTPFLVEVEPMLKDTQSDDSSHQQKIRAQLPSQDCPYETAMRWLFVLHPCTTLSERAQQEAQKTTNGNLLYPMKNRPAYTAF
jgi:hypothetical protein